jgi:hypothetical protein
MCYLYTIYYILRAAIVHRPQTKKEAEAQQPRTAAPTQQHPAPQKAQKREARAGGGGGPHSVPIDPGPRTRTEDRQLCQLPVAISDLRLLANQPAALQCSPPVSPVDGLRQSGWRLGVCRLPARAGARVPRAACRVKHHTPLVTHTTHTIRHWNWNRGPLGLPSFPNPPSFTFPIPNGVPCAVRSPACKRSAAG